ncbi:MAG: 4Fe-4S binding protein [Proteobacteria bacterium]|nr:4Fe-4S binding protein [Pseudomonadota bacterium]MBU1058098.1 4Fe-4S binding protein [Pseudomonadota bacterium]
MKQLSIMVDMDRCIGCKTCVVACRNHHNLVNHRSHMPGEIPFYIKVESQAEGTFPHLKEDFWVSPCKHCKTAPCATACESGAIRKDAQTGIVLIDKDKCTGAKKCIEKCPYNVIQFNAEKNYAHKCNMCYDRVVHGEEPVCVEICLTNALSFGEKEILKMQAQANGKEIIKAMSSQSIIYVKSSS